MRNVFTAFTAVVLLLTIPEHAKATTSGSLTLATYNIHSGIPEGSSIASSQPTIANLHNVADVLTTTAADIVALQEVRNFWGQPARDKTHINIPLYLATVTDMNYAFGSTLDSTSGYPENRNYTEWGHANQWTNNGEPHGEFGNAFLSKLDFLPPSIIKLPRGDDADAKKLSDEPRNAVRVQLREQIPSLGTVVIYSTHLQHNNGKTREAQMTELLRAAKADATTATVFVLGDMNHYPHTGEPDLLALVQDAGFVDLAADFAAKSRTDAQPTINNNGNKRRIDYIFCSRPVNVTNAIVLDTPVSDHLPLAVTISLE